MPTVIDDAYDTWDDLQGIERSVAGNTPFLLDDPAKVWLVLQGRVEVFCVTVVEGQPDGPRHHYLTADPGDALFGIDQARYGQGLGLLAVGAVGTRLREIPFAQLRSRPEPPVGLVDKWVAGLSRGVARMIVPQPRADLTLDAGAEGQVGTGGRVRAHKGVVWISHVSGSSLFIGMEERETDAAEALFPLTQDSFFQALEPTRMIGVDSRSALSDEDGWRGLDAFYGPLFRCEFFNTRLAAADELNRLTDKAERDRRSREAALINLASVVSHRSPEFADIPADDPLLAACTVVARRLGMRVEAPPMLKEGEASTDPLGDILRTSRIRARKVLLKGNWWTLESWPMLARIEDGQRPVALLPTRRPGGFELHDPVTHTTALVTKEVAETLAAQAYTFYRSLPETARRPLALFKFAMLGTGRDIARPLLLGIIAGFLGMVPPYFMGLLVDDVIPEGNRGQLVQLAIILAVIALTTTSFGIVRQLSVLRLETKASASLQPALWDHLLGLPSAFFRRFTAGDLAQRAGAIDAMRRVLSGATMSSIMTSVFSIFLLGQLFYYNWQLALWATGLVAVALIFIGLIGYLRLRVQRPMMEVDGRISGLVLQLLTGIAKLRVAGAEDRAFSVWAREFAQQKRLSLRSGRIDSLVATWNVGFPVTGSMVIFFLVLYLSGEAMREGKPPLSTGDFIAFNTAFGTFLFQMLELGTAAISVLSIIPLFERAKPVLETKSETDVTKADPGELSGRIEVEHVGFRYHPDGPLVLADVSISAAPGEFVALVGPSGSGKSTLARLLLGLEVPESGSIYYDGRDLAQLDVQKLRRRIGVVMQAGKIRPGSLLDNIIGSAPLSINDAWDAARQAGLDEDIKQMPMGMQTVMQQGGPTLSGGQRQRLMIARAIVDRPRVLIFDEATSALDNRTQAIVTESLQRLQATRIAIAHRLSTIVGADRIYVLEDGRVVQAGTYDELAAQPGLFAQLIKRQLA